MHSHFFFGTQSFATILPYGTKGRLSKNARIPLIRKVSLSEPIKCQKAYPFDSS